MSGKQEKNQNHFNGDLKPRTVKSGEVRDLKSWRNPALFYVYLSSTFFTSASYHFLESARAFDAVAPCISSLLLIFAA